MNLFKVFFFLFVLLTGNVLIAKKTIVSGQVENPRERSMSIMFYDNPITSSEVNYTVYFKTDNTFYFELNIEEPKLIQLSHGVGTTNIFIEPNDSVYLSFSGRSIDKTIVHSGNGSTANTFLKTYQYQFGKYDKQASFKMRKLESEAFKTYINDITERKALFYNKSESKSGFSKAFIAFIEADIQYWKAYRLLYYLWEYPYANNLQAPLNVPDSYYDFLDKADFDNDLAMSNNNYIYFLDQYIKYQSEKSINKNIPLHTLAPKYLASKPLYYVLGNHFYMYCKRNKIKGLEYAIENYLVNNPYQSYTKVIVMVYAETKNIMLGSPAPAFSLVDINGRRVSLSQFKGKVVYLDFWATWCGPCLAEVLESSKRLYPKLSGKDVVFIYISLDKSRNSWRNYVKKHELKGVHLFAAGLYKSDIAKKYNVYNVPAFFLIDKAGRIAKNPARRPTEGGAYEDILELLKDKRNGSIK